MKKILMLCLMLSSLSGLAQIDTIYVSGKVVPCNIAEVTETAVRFKYPNEDHLNVFSLNVVEKIVFKSGRTQKFAVATSFKRLESPEDWEKVSMSTVEGEVAGLYKIGEVSSKAKGTTELSNQERVRKRAVKKIKMQAAMMGANVIYMMQIRNEGNKIGYYVSSSAETSLMGMAYSSELPNIDVVKKQLNERPILFATKLIKLYNSDSEYSITSLKDVQFKPKSIRDDNGIIMIEGTISKCRNTDFRVTYFNEKDFYITYTDKSGTYSYKIVM